MSVLTKLRATIWAALVSLGLIFAFWLRRDARADARRDTLTQQKQKDEKNAEAITRRLSADRHKRLQDYADRGYRD